MDAVVVRNLNFRYDSDTPLVLRDVSLRVTRGSRLLLVGGNGAGKSTLLRVLGGTHSFPPESEVTVLSRDAFRDTTLNADRQLMDPNWGLRTVAFAGVGVPYSSDLVVGDMMSHLQVANPERREKLARVLGVNLGWWWNRLSDGQRRRVQLFLGLLRPFDLVLLDEVTALLDVLCRADLLEFLRGECESRGCTVVVASHVFDNMAGFATHVCHLREGRVAHFGELRGVPEFERHVRESHSEHEGLLRLVEGWLREDRKGVEEESGEEAFVARSMTACSTTSAGGYAPGRSAQLTERSLNYEAMQRGY